MLINIIATSTTAEQCRVQEAQFSAFLQDVQVNSTSLPWHLLPVEDRQIVHPGKKNVQEHSKCISISFLKSQTSHQHIIKQAR
jgi:hypothetical protein